MGNIGDISLAPWLQTLLSEGNLYHEKLLAIKAAKTKLREAVDNADVGEIEAAVTEAAAVLPQCYPTLPHQYSMPSAC